MAITPLSLKSNYWLDLKIQESDLEYLYNHLLELETPQTTEELVQALILERIRLETENLTKRQIGNGTIFTPKETYQIGQNIVFPALNWKQGIVIGTRPGHHPDAPTLEVIQVQFSPTEIKEFGTNLPYHYLNQPISVSLDDPQLNKNFVLDQFGQNLKDQLDELLSSNHEIVKIAGRWFPEALLVDVNVGHLNLAEAVLDMAGGGPLTTSQLLEQIELPTDVNPKLTEFSLNLALQEDGRFDEIGPAGEIVWYLKRLEPEAVRNAPVFLKYLNPNYDSNIGLELLNQLDSVVVDELDADKIDDPQANELVLSLIYPHWRAGTLPLSRRVALLFPTAYESPRVQFKFIDPDSKEEFSGWVVRPSKFVYGLKEWYSSLNLLPGSLIHIKRGLKKGEVMIRAERHRPTREWIRTALIGTDGGLVFAMLKQMVACSFDERMAIAIPDQNAMDQLWDTTSRSRQPFENIIRMMMQELSKLNPQGHVHLQELYTSVNLVRRCPPSLILNIVLNSSWAYHLGDLYFRLNESGGEGGL